MHLHLPTQIPDKQSGKWRERILNNVRYFPPLTNWHPGYNSSFYPCYQNLIPSTNKRIIHQQCSFNRAIHKGKRHLSPVTRKFRCKLDNIGVHSFRNTTCVYRDNRTCWLFARTIARHYITIKAQPNVTKI